MNVKKNLFGFGLLLAFLAASLLLLDVIDSGIATAVGMLGIGFIAVSRFRPLIDSMLHSPKMEPVQTIYSPDKKQRAVIKRFGGGDYQIEIQRFIHEYSPDVGSHDRWERTSASMNSSLEEAIEMAAKKVGAGMGDFFGSRDQ